MSDNKTFHHVPVLLNECINGLAINENGIYVDGTAGGAGHSLQIAKLLTSGKLYSLDQDPSAVEIATKRLEGLNAQVVQTNFKDIKKALKPYGVNKINGALLDLGVSSHQLDTVERGFTYNENAPLDMRMSQSGKSAAEILNNYTRQEIADILKKYGEETYAWNIAGKIEEYRAHTQFKTSLQLIECIHSALPSAVRRKNKNPARKTFQALRIAVNEELTALEEGLENIFDMLLPNGRFCIITFHSLEDRIVKHTFKKWQIACTCPPQFPVCVCGGVAKAKAINKKPIIADENQLSINNRARSAKLRIIEKI